MDKLNFEDDFTKYQQDFVVGEVIDKINEIVDWIRACDGMFEVETFYVRGVTMIGRLMIYVNLLVVGEWLSNYVRNVIRRGSNND